MPPPRKRLTVGQKPVSEAVFKQRDKAVQKLFKHARGVLPKSRKRTGWQKQGLRGRALARLNKEEITYDEYLEEINRINQLSVPAAIKEYNGHVEEDDEEQSGSSDKAQGGDDEESDSDEEESDSDDEDEDERRKKRPTLLGAM